MIGNPGIGRLLFSGMLVTVLICRPSVSHAYIDPGTGGLIIQSVIAGLAVAGVAIRLYWRKLKGLFSRIRKQR